MKLRMLQSDRGVALLIVLLVTALLLALVFEFAYATRVSVRAAANFRDSQRAYFLARSGVNFVGKVLVDDLQQKRLQDNLEQKEWQVVPVISAGDAELRVRWEDEAGKLNIAENLQVRNLFTVMQVDQRVAERIAERVAERGKFFFLSELHEVMDDEEYNKVINYITTFTAQQTPVSINTAPLKVLQTRFISAAAGADTDAESIAEDCIRKRISKPFESSKDIADFLEYRNIVPSNVNAKETSDYFRIHSHATVGEYTRQVEAVIHRTATGFTVLSWRSL
jgi:type II secretory pathway component PulK